VALLEVGEDQTDTAWSESDELRDALHAAQPALNDAATEAPLAKVQT
jgi:hypothetical protein